MHKINGLCNLFKDAEILWCFVILSRSIEAKLNNEGIFSSRFNWLHASADAYFIMTVNLFSKFCVQWSSHGSQAKSLLVSR